MITTKKRPDGLIEVFENGKRISTTSSESFAKQLSGGSLPSLNDVQANTQPDLPSGDPNVDRFTNLNVALNKAVDLARQKRQDKTLDFLGGVIPKGALPATSFASVIEAFNRGSAPVESTFAKSALEAVQSDTELLSVSDAKTLGVPFGTTVSEAAGKGIIPTGTDTSDTDFKTAKEYAAVFQGTDEELKSDLIENSDLSISEIDSIIASRPFTRQESAELQPIAVGFIKASMKGGGIGEALDIFGGTQLSKDERLSIAKSKAIDLIEQGKYKIGNAVKTLSESEKNELKRIVLQLTIDEVK